MMLDNGNYYIYLNFKKILIVIQMKIESIICEIDFFFLQKRQFNATRMC